MLTEARMRDGNLYSGYLWGKKKAQIGQKWDKLNSVFGREGTAIRIKINYKQFTKRIYKKFMI